MALRPSGMKLSPTPRVYASANPSLRILFLAGYFNDTSSAKGAGAARMVWNTVNL